MPELAQTIAARSDRRDISPDAFIIPATPYDQLRTHYDDETWDRAKFADKHILFPERSKSYDYIRIILANHEENNFSQGIG